MAILLVWKRGVYMKTTFKTYFKVLLNLLTAIAVVLAVIYLLPKVLVFFMPFVIGWVISLIATPIVKFFEEKLKIRRKAGSVLVIVLVLAIVIAIVYGICYFLVVQAIGFIKDFPTLWSNIVVEFEKIGDSLTGFYDKLPANVQDAITNFTENGNKYISNIPIGAGAKESGETSALTNIVSGIPDVIMGIVMALLSSYLFVAEKDYLGNAIDRYLPKSVGYNLDIIKRSIKNAFGGYFKAQLKIEVWVYLITIIGFLILRIEYSFLIAFLICFMDFLPVFGAGGVMIPWALFELFEKDYRLAIGIFITWAVGQFVRDMIQPKFVGDSVGIAPIPTLFLLYIGYKISGVAGMIFAVPIGIILKNLYNEGTFDTTIESFNILVAGFNRFRRLQQSDKDIITDYESDVENEYKHKYGADNNEIKAEEIK